MSEVIVEPREGLGGGLIEILSEYDEKLQAAYEGAPKIVFQTVSVATGPISAPQVHDDFLPLVQSVRAEVATGLRRMLVDETNDIFVKDGECFGYSPTLGGFVILALRDKEAKVVRRIEEWDEKDWEMVKGVKSELTNTLDTLLPYMEAMSDLAKKVAQSRPGRDSSSWPLLAGGR